MPPRSHLLRAAGVAAVLPALALLARCTEFNGPDKSVAPAARTAERGPAGAPGAPGAPVRDAATVGRLHTDAMEFARRHVRTHWKRSYQGTPAAVCNETIRITRQWLRAAGYGADPHVLAGVRDGIENTRCRDRYDRRLLADVPARPSRASAAPSPLAAFATFAARLQDDGLSPHAIALGDRIVHAPPAGLDVIASVVNGANGEAASLSEPDRAFVAAVGSVAINSYAYWTTNIDQWYAGHGDPNLPLSAMRRLQEQPDPERMEVASRVWNADVTGAFAGGINAARGLLVTGTLFTHVAPPAILGGVVGGGTVGSVGAIFHHLTFGGGGGGGGSGSPPLPGGCRSGYTMDVNGHCIEDIH